MGRSSNRKKDRNAEPRTVQGRIKILRVLQYQGQNVYIREIDVDIFEYLVVLNGEIYSSYWVFTPEKGQKTLTDVQVNSAMQMALAGAFATIETKLGIDTLNPQQKGQAEEFLKVAENAFGTPEN